MQSLRRARSEVAGRVKKALRGDLVDTYKLTEGALRNLLRLAISDLRNPSGYLVICALGLLGLMMAVAVHF